MQAVQSPVLEWQLTQLVQGSHVVALLVVENVLGAQTEQPAGAVALMNCPGGHCEYALFMARRRHRSWAAADESFILIINLF